MVATVGHTKSHFENHDPDHEKKQSKEDQKAEVSLQSSTKKVNINKEAHLIDYSKNIKVLHDAIGDYEKMKEKLAENLASSLSQFTAKLSKYVNDKTGLEMNGALEGDPVQQAGKHSYNFFLVLFQFLRNDMQANGEQTLGALNHMNTEEKNQQNTVVTLQQTQKVTRAKFDAAEKKKKKLGLLGKILGPIIAVILAVATLGVGSSLGVASLVGESAVEGAAGEATAETAAGALSSTTEQAAGDAFEEIPMQEMGESVSSSLEGEEPALFNSRTSMLEDGASEAEAASSADTATTNAEETVENAVEKTAEKGSIQWNKPSLSRLAKNAKYVVPGVTTIAVTAATAIPGAINGVNQDFATTAQELSQNEQMVMTEESNITDQINIDIQRDNQTGVTATKQASESDASLANQFSGIMANMYKLGSI
ncbi:MAG: hypothetical protein S4CHLAM37_11770 [Chlamydiia bacterium]|nr:hypothetical protein [Chlamydiia bacterium]